MIFLSMAQDCFTFQTFQYRLANKHQKIPKGQYKMDNAEKMATQGTQDENNTKQKHNPICVGHHYAQANTNIVNKTRALLQTTGGKDEPNIVFMRKS